MSFASSAPSSNVSRSQTPLGVRTDSPSGGKARVDDKYFAGLGAANASRPADLPPSQGGKYAGFGSTPMENTKPDAKLPGFDDLQRDPVAALTKGFGWFTTTVGKTAKNVNEGYIQPTAAKVCSFPASFRPTTLLSNIMYSTCADALNTVSRDRPSSSSTNHGRTSRTRCANRSKERSRRLQPLCRRQRWIFV